MHTLEEWMSAQLVVPYLRHCDLPVRQPWKYAARRNLLDYLLIYVEEGTLEVCAEGEELLLEAGDFCLLQPGTVHTLAGITRTNTPYAHLDLFYQDRRTESFATLPGQVDLSPFERLMQPRLNGMPGVRVPVKLAPRYPERFRELLVGTIERWLEPDGLSRLDAQHMAMELVRQLIRDHYRARPDTERRGPFSPDWVTPFLSYRLTDPLSVEELARRAHLSPSRFRYLFREHFGMPPRRYLTQLRLRYAAELLETTAYPLEKVAAYCGFADKHHFSKAFKQAMRVTPGAYRSGFR
ncbi:helix-turn-helix domain-containing protein [Cohnella hongkongensis]|uniref:Helix-turn-helix domain-containing protein n=1 Tax=Cohnella hongkongensis TaxID=178337 RepID=A0ABV9F906_9BACL